MTIGCILCWSYMVETKKSCTSYCHSFCLAQICCCRGAIVIPPCGKMCFQSRLFKDCSQAKLIVVHVPLQAHIISLSVIIGYSSCKYQEYDGFDHLDHHASKRCSGKSMAVLHIPYGVQDSSAVTTEARHAPSHNISVLQNSRKRKVCAMNLLDIP